jgi:hypothetical protein
VRETPGEKERRDKVLTNGSDDSDDRDDGAVKNLISIS